VVDRAGIGCESASAAAVAGARALAIQGVVAPGDRVVAILTGHVLKEPLVSEDAMAVERQPLIAEASLQGLADALAKAEASVV
jgi:threonine synthase